MREILKRTRWIWAVVYAFLTGMSVGRREFIGVAMFALGGIALFWMTTRWMNQLRENTAKSAGSVGTVTVKFEADISQATAAIDALRDQALSAKSDIDAVFTHRRPPSSEQIDAIRANEGLGPLPKDAK